MSGSRRLYAWAALLGLFAFVTRLAQHLAGAPDGEADIVLVPLVASWSALLVGHIVEAIERKGDA